MGVKLSLIVRAVCSTINEKPPSDFSIGRAVIGARLLPLSIWDFIASIASISVYKKIAS
jgi:hypothetical protein